MQDANTPDPGASIVCAHPQALPEAIRIQRTAPYGPHGQAYELTLVAIRAETRRPGFFYLNEWGADPAAVPDGYALTTFREPPPQEERLTFLPDQSSPNALYEIRAVWLRHPDSPAFAEVAWSETGIPRPSVTDPTFSASDGQMDAARRALRLLLNQMNRGGHPTLEESGDEWREIARQAEEDKRKHPGWSWPYIADRYYLSEKTLRRYRARLARESRGVSVR